MIDENFLAFLMKPAMPRSFAIDNSAGPARFGA
jgi:hypothetical protein